MAEERSFLQKLLNPTEEEKRKIIEGIEEGRKYSRILDKEGFKGLVTRIAEQEALDQGQTEEEVLQNREKVEQFLKTNDSVINKFIPTGKVAEIESNKNLFGSAQAAEPEEIPEIKKEKRSVGIQANEFNEISTGESVANAVVSGLIKIPQGFVNFGTLIYDAFQEEGIPVSKSLTAKVNNKFENSVLGVIANQAEDKARETAAGKITEAIIQLYGAGKIAQKTAVPAVTKLTQKSRQLADKLVGKIKKDRYVKTTNNKNLYNVKKKVDQLNKASGFDKFVGVTVGGGLGAGAVVMKAEDIGTFGDIFESLPTTLDREEKKSSSEDAARQLINKLKFGAELGFPILPFFYGAGLAGKAIATRGKELAYSNRAIERWVDKFAEKFRARSFKAEDIFVGTQKLEGTKAALKLVADDFSKNIDDSLKAISKETKRASQALEPETLSKMMSEFMLTTPDSVVNKRIVFNGFSKESTKAFTQSMEKLGVSNFNIDKIISDADLFRRTIADLKQAVLSGKNINVGTKEFNNIMNDRTKNFLSSDYKIFDANTGFLNGYKPTLETKKEVADVFARYSKANKTPIDEDEAMQIVDNIVKQASKNPVTKTPEFPFGTKNFLDDKAVQVKNIAENITSGGKFKADGKGGLIQTKSDLQAFKNLFGEYKDAKKVIFNSMEDMGEILGRDRFYNNLLKASDELIKRGERGLFYKNYDEALINFPNQKIFAGRDGLKLKTNLAEEIYTSPIDGKFTRADFAEAIRIGDDIVSSPLTRSVPYRMLFLIPKGVTQAFKTVLGPFTHARNFTSAMVTAVHSGNIFISPMAMGNAIKMAYKATQPQALYRMTNNPRFRNTSEGQGLYKFLLEEGVVNQSAVYRDVEGLITDIAKGGDFVTKFYNSMGRKLKGAVKVAQDFYVAEDDAFRIINFLGEQHKLTQAFKKGVEKGIVKKMPSELELMQEAAAVVRETVPNYAYVSDFVKSVRRSPLGNFASFPAEIVRTTANATARSIKEIKDPIRKSIGYRRLLGQGITYAALPIMAYEGARALYGVSREKVAAMRELLPSFSKDNTIMPVYENGKYKYIDFSHGFFYDTLLNPVQSVLANVEAQGEEPLIKGLATGMAKAMSSFMEPFVSESIYLGVVLDLFARNGVTRRGTRIFNERDSLGNKLSAAFKHAAYQLSPGSLPQVKRMVAALTDETIKGTQYEIPDELMGLLGFRKVPLDLNKSLNFKLAEFREDERNERGLIYKGTLTGDPVKDQELIVKQFIFANEQRFETFNSMRRFYDALKVLGMRDKEIKQEFADRGMTPLYKKIQQNRFKPLVISDRMIEVYEQLAKEKGIPNPLNKRSEKMIKRIIKRLKKQRLNRDFIIDQSMYVSDASSMQTPPLPNTPSPRIMAQTQQKDPITNLTRVESALLSDPLEREIASRT
jgi:hypothetical protein